jgi:hypothetical protein
MPHIGEGEPRVRIKLACFFTPNDSPDHAGVSFSIFRHSSLAREGRQSAKQRQSIRPRAYAPGNQLYREAIPRQQDRHEQQQKASRGIPAFLYRSSGIKTVQEEARQMHVAAREEFERQ